MAELLVKARDPWQITETGSRKGDVIMVRPDGWPWGKCECLPGFVVVKVPGTAEENKHLEDKISENVEISKDVYEYKILKFRKYNMKTVEVDAVALQVKDYEEIVPVSIDKVNIVDKSIVEVGKIDGVTNIENS